MNFKTISFTIALLSCLATSCGGPTASTTETEKKSIDRLQTQPTDTKTKPVVPESRARTEPEDPQHTPRVTNIVDTDTIFRKDPDAP